MRSNSWGERSMRLKKCRVVTKIFLVDGGGVPVENTLNDYRLPINAEIMQNND